MGKKIIQVISEVNRMNDLMRFSENREILNESIASALKGLRSLIKNNLNDIAKYGIPEVDNLLVLMTKSKTPDNFFELLSNIKTHDLTIAQQLRRNIFEVLPEPTKKRTTQIVQYVENNIDSLPEENVDELLDAIIKNQYPNEPESVRLFMKDSLLDISDSISKKVDDANLKSNLDDLLFDGLDDLTSEVSSTLETLDTDEAIRKAFLADNELWNNKFTRIFIDRRKELTRALQSYKIDDATKVALKGKTKDEIKELLRKEIKTSLEGPENSELLNIIKDKSLLGQWKSMTWRNRLSFILWSTLGTTSFGIITTAIAYLFSKYFEGRDFLEDTLDDLITSEEVKSSGRITKLNDDNKESIIVALKNDTNVEYIFDTHGNIIDNKYMLNFTTSEDELEILNIQEGYKVEKTYSLDDINKLLTNN